MRKEVTMRQAKNLEKKIQRFITDNKVGRMNKKFEAFLFQEGFRFANLGTGASAYTCSLMIGMKEIASKKYLNGTYLVVGVANQGRGGWSLYRGWVIPVTD